MLVNRTSEVFRHQIEREVGKDATGKQVLDFIFGVYDGDYKDVKHSYVLRRWYKDDKTKLQRLNMFWAWPLTLILAPFQYVMKGQVGWDDRTKMGRFILKAVGYYREE